MDVAVSLSGQDRTGPREFRETDDPEMLSTLFAARFARLQFLISQRSKCLADNDWQVRLLHKALFSTWRDIKELPVLVQPLE